MIEQTRFGIKIHVRKFFSSEEILIGEEWMDVSGNIVKVTNKSRDSDDTLWVEYQSKDGKLNEKMNISFQSRFCKIAKQVLGKKLGKTYKDGYRKNFDRRNKREEPDSRKKEKFSKTDRNKKYY